MSKTLFIKNGLVLTLSPENKTGYYNIAIRNGKITDIDYNQNLSEEDFLRANPDAEVIDALDKIIMPGFLNSAVNSTFSLNKLFFKKCSFENISGNVPLRLVTRFLSNPINKDVLKKLFSINYIRAMRNGEVFVNEISPVISKDFYTTYIQNYKWRQYYNFVTFNNSFIQFLTGKENNFLYGFKPDGDINNYSLTSLKKSLKNEKLKLYFEASQSHNNVESLMNIFGKPFVEVLDDFDLLSENTIFFNPVFLTHREINKLKENNVNLIFSPSDIMKFSNRAFDPVEYFSAGINIMLGTGLQGKDILSELKIMSTLLYKYNFPYEKLMRLVTTNAAETFGISNHTGSIEKNKSADLIFFSLTDVRNLFTLPEIDAEKLCEFIIEELSVKDISDIIIKGNILVRNGEESYKKDYISMADEIAEQLYEEGKYFEFKEKYLRRKRVNEVSLKKEEQRSDAADDLFDDNFDPAVSKDEGEFRIIGKKFENKSEIQNNFFEKPESVHSLSEIESLGEGFNLIDELDEKESRLKQEEKQKIIDAQSYSLFEDKEAKSPGKTPGKSPEKSQTESEKKKESEITFQKNKMRFGFSDED